MSSTGIVDMTFSGTFNGTISGIQLLPDGSMLVAGGFATVNGIPRSYLARITSTGALDTTFQPTLNASVSTFALDLLNQSFYFGGAFTTVDGLTRLRFARMGLVPEPVC